MLSPIDVKNLGQTRYNEMLAEAAVARRIQRTNRSETQLGVKLGNFLIRLGQKLEAQPAARANSSI